MLHKAFPLNWRLNGELKIQETYFHRCQSKITIPLDIHYFVANLAFQSPDVFFSNCNSMRKASTTAEPSANKKRANITPQLGLSFRHAS